MCDRCVSTFDGRPFCNRTCRTKDLLQRNWEAISGKLRSPVPGFWYAVAITVAVLIAGGWITILAVRLHGLKTDALDATQRLPYAVAELVREGDGLSLEIQGSASATVVVLADGEPVRVLTLDDKGRGHISGEAIREGASLEIAAFAEPPEPIAPLPKLSPTSTHTARPSTTAVAALSATASPRPTATQSPTASAKPIASPKPTPTSSRTGLQPSPTAPARGAKPPRSPAVLHLVTDAGPKIAITFDGNASSNGTSELLNLLHELDLEITLFVTGRFVEKYPTLLRRAVLAGHEVGNHSFSHPHLTSYADNRRHTTLPGVTREMLQSQLRRTEEAFRKATGRPMAPLWRAPFGEENSALRGWALELGYLHVRWSSLEGASLDSLDWIADEHSNLYRDSKTMIDRLLNFPRLEGGIVLMHLATERSEPPWTELPRFVAELRRRDLETVKITDLLQASDTWRPWLEKAQKRHDETFGE